MYNISEVFLSRQGEGHNVGQTAIFVRFGGCNLKCQLKKTKLSPGGFNCDTDFVSAKKIIFGELREQIVSCVGDMLLKYRIKGPPDWIIFTGGEPMLQLDQKLVDFCRTITKVGIETNGTFNCDHLGLDWICVSPKVAEHCIKQKTANEVKYIRSHGQPLPKTVVVADHYLVSPTFEGLNLDPINLEWCQDLVKGTKWRLSIQQHKMVNIR